MLRVLGAMESNLCLWVVERHFTEMIFYKTIGEEVGCHHELKL